LRRITWLLKR